MTQHHPLEGAALPWGWGFSCQALCWVLQPLQDMGRDTHFPSGGSCQQAGRAKVQRSKPTRSLPTGMAILQGACKVATPEVSTGQSAAVHWAEAMHLTYTRGDTALPPKRTLLPIPSDQVWERPSTWCLEPLRLQESLGPTLCP